MEQPIVNTRPILKNESEYEFDEFNSPANVHEIFKLGGYEKVYAKGKIGKKLILRDEELGRIDLYMPNNYEVYDLRTGALLKDHTHALHKGSTISIGPEYLAAYAQHENARHEEVMHEIRTLEKNLPDYEQPQD